MRAVRSLSLLVLIALGCSGGSQGNQMNSEIQRGPMPQGGTWGGVWFTNWGTVTLSSQGTSVVGEFCHEERNRFGRFEGTAQGDVFSFHWITTDLTMGGRPRTSEGAGILQFSFVAAGENQQAHFDGTWGFGGSNADGGPMHGDRSSRYSEPFLRGTYSVPCALRDENEADAPMSDDDVGDNPGNEETPEDDYSSELSDEGGEDGEGPLDDI